MATLAPLSHMGRQPFAALGESRLWSLANIKNIQNAIPATPPGSLKRSREASDVNNHDIENIDPRTYSTPLKKKNRSGLDESVPSTKVPLFNFNAMASTSARAIRPIRGSTHGKTAIVATPITVKTLASSQVPKSAPAAPGKSPKTKRKGILSTRRSSTPFTRVDPPITHAALPFSIDAAVTDTVPSLLHYPNSRGSTSFNIYEEPELDQIQTLMDNSTRHLDISDDEERIAAKYDRGKENIPPPDDPTANRAINTAIPATRRNLMTDEPRTPLGDLNAAEYYAEGYDSDSYTIVAGDNEVEQHGENYSTIKSETDLSGQSDANLANGSNNGWDDLLAQVEAANKAQTAALGSEFNPIVEVNEDETATTAIEIWESESASAENEAAAHDAPVSAVA